jgi:hypothetical protein
MRHDVRDAFDPIQAELFDNQEMFEKKIMEIDDPVKRREALTRYTMEQGERVVKKALETGDLLWTKYDEKF